MNGSDRNRKMNRSVFVGGDVGGNVQNVHGSGASAASGNPPGEIMLLISRLQQLTRQLEPGEAAECAAALTAVEESMADPGKNRFTIKGALAALAGAATAVTGWADAVIALKHALGPL